jgi:hypothetical protein
MVEAWKPVGNVTLDVDEFTPHEHVLRAWQQGLDIHAREGRYRVIQRASIAGERSFYYEEFDLVEHCEMRIQRVDVPDEQPTETPATA